MKLHKAKHCIFCVTLGLHVVDGGIGSIVRGSESVPGHYLGSYMQKKMVIRM